MQYQDAVEILKTHETDLKKMGVIHLYMFGSMVRGEQREDSDVDMFFDYEREGMTLFRLMDIQEKASEILGRKADITTRDSIHPFLRSEVENSARRVF